MATWKDINLDFMHEKDVVVNCRTKEGLRALTKAIGEAYPRYRPTFQTKYELWERDHDDEGMTIRAELCEDGTINYGHCFAWWYREEGYKVLELCDITHTAKDLGALNTGYMDINAALAALF